MGQLGGVGMRQRGKHAPQNLHGAAQRHLTVSPQRGAQRRALDEGPRVVDERSRASGALGPHETRMPQAAGQKDELALEGGRVHPERQLAGQDLHEQLGPAGQLDGDE